MKLRILSFNIQHGFNYKTKAGIDLPAVADAIRSFSPDFVGLNEVRGRGRTEEYTAQAETIASLLGYHCYFGRSIYVGGTEPYGNAVLSRYPIVGTKIIRIPDPIICASRVESRSVIRAEIELPEEKRLAAYVSHFGLSGEEREHAVSTTLAALRDERLPFVLMGDFNMEPDDPLLSPFFRELTDSSPFTDGKKSFPSDCPSGKIDYIFTSREIAVRFADIPQIVVSDHCPIYADIEF